MNKGLRETFETIAQENGLRFNSESETLFGNVQGYTLCMVPTQNYLYTLYLSVSNYGNLPDAQAMKSIVKSAKIIKSCTVQRYKVGFMMQLNGKRERTCQLFHEALEAITSFLQHNGYTNCCQDCGQDHPTEPCHVAGAAVLMCEDCFAKASSAVDFKHQTIAQKKENVLGGVVGALIGSILGAAVIVLLGQLGYVAALSGIVIAICSLKGYELLGGKLSNKGIIISCIAMLVMIYLGNQADWAVTAATYFEVDFFTAFRGIPELLREGYIESSAYYGNLAMVYVFAVVGAVPTIYGTIKSRKQQHVTGKMIVK